MIRARFDVRDRTVIMAGLSGENVARLANDEPILKPLEDIGLPGMDLVVFYEQTDELLKKKVDWFRESLRRPTTAPTDEAGAP